MLKMGECPPIARGRKRNYTENMCRLAALFLCIALSFAFAAKADGREGPYTFERCLLDWKGFMADRSENDVRAFCQCIEDEKTKSPIPAEKGSRLTGPGGMNDAGPWPAIFKNCLFPEKPLTPQETGKDGHSK